MNSKYRAFMRMALERNEYKVFYTILARLVYRKPCPILTTFDWDRYAINQYYRKHMTDVAVRRIIKRFCLVYRANMVIDCEGDWHGMPMPEDLNLRSPEVLAWVEKKIYPLMMETKYQVLAPSNTMAELSIDAMIEFVDKIMSRK